VLRVYTTTVTTITFITTTSQSMSKESTFIADANIKKINATAAAL